MQGDNNSHSHSHSRSLRLSLQRAASRRYDMTGETGSYRYMAPEVFRHEPYNSKVVSKDTSAARLLPVIH